MGKDCTHATECTDFTDIPDVNYSLPAFHCLSLEMLGKTSHISENSLKIKEVTVKSKEAHFFALGWWSIFGLTGSRGA